MPSEHGPAAPSPDDFDRQLRDLASGAAGAARFREPSAAERARRAAAQRGRPAGNWRGGQQARRLRRPASAAEGRRTASGRFWRRRARLDRVGSRPGQRPVAGPRRKRLLSVAKGVGILVGFAALLVLMHLLGLGPR